MKKILKIGLGIFIVIGLYLYLSHAYIYFRIGQGNLKATGQNQVILATNNMAEKQLKLVTLGDSLTAGAGTDKYEESYPYLVAQKLAKNEKVILQNLSYPGAKTADLIRDLLPQAIADQPDVVTLLIGVNDIHGHISQAGFQANYRYILERLTKETKAKIFVISLPYLGNSGLIFPPYSFYFEKETAAFNAIIKNLAKEYKVHYVELGTAVDPEFKKDGGLYAADSFHPSAKGYALYSEIIYAGINQ